VVGVIADAHAEGDDAEVPIAYPLEHADWTWVPGPV
jgi:hypothetical protein